MKNYLWIREQTESIATFFMTGRYVERKKKRFTSTSIFSVAKKSFKHRVSNNNNHSSKKKYKIKTNWTCMKNIRQTKSSSESAQYEILILVWGLKSKCDDTLRIYVPFAKALCTFLNIFTVVWMHWMHSDHLHDVC